MGANIQQPIRDAKTGEKSVLVAEAVLIAALGAEGGRLRVIDLMWNGRKGFKVGEDSLEVGVGYIAVEEPRHGGVDLPATGTAGANDLDELLLGVGADSEGVRR